ncbi:prolipoprotein diacylglyceryl transferase [Pseudonocardia sp. MH-G8]|uniref:prolipoprotein diacylglyceryl transferase n=1 Tax=Pseudonocardia sp. MH-G8 TaxID=1854588 RepID=UPI000BA00682|nr:prolipoprotein diacylglyceryl transferase family protein [Pseudonocardia sp. MH-G8]OZM76364.1 diacylglyceryl transferase [Pseudonocardia sp. MH-G8]
MYPTLFEIFGLPIGSYGVSKALAALAAVVLLTREFRRLRWDPDVATTLVLATTLVGFLGAKLYYLAEHLGSLSVHDFGGSGFTWYGGFLAGVATFVVIARRHRLPLAELAAVSAAPASVAYGIGRLGCLLAGDGTYGTPSDLPWAMAFPNGVVPTTVPVHPTPLYETVAAFAIAGLLWSVRHRWRPTTVVGTYAVLTGTARFLVEIVRVNDEAVLGLTQPQLWSLALVVAGAALLTLPLRASTPGPAESDDVAGAPGGTRV